MKLFELLIALGLVAVVFSFATPRSNHSLETAHSALLSHLKILQLTALSDDNALLQLQDAKDIAQAYPAIDTQSLVGNHHNAMWQMQFHLGKVYTTHSVSLYIDTPRHSHSTDFDNRPMAADIILKNMDRKCLSGYNNNNTATECKDNADMQTRLGERFGIDEVILESDSFCKERESGRIYFDRFGAPYCGKVPTALQSVFKITLRKQNATKSICILPHSGLISPQC